MSQLYFACFQFVVHISATCSIWVAKDATAQQCPEARMLREDNFWQLSLVLNQQVDFNPFLGQKCTLHYIISEDSLNRQRIDRISPFSVLYSWVLSCPKR